MSAIHVMVVAIGGFFGAIARFYVSEKWNRNIEKIPYGTLFVNLIGSFLLGFFLSYGLKEVYLLLLGTGFLGAFTTFSTFNKELRTLQKYPRKWTIYFTVTYAGGFCLAFLGYFLGK